jgi:hypothetical protein
MEVSCQLHALAACLPRERAPWYSLDRRLGGLQSQSGRGGEDINSQRSPGLEPPIIQSVAQRYTTELPRLLGHFIIEVENKYEINCSVVCVISHSDQHK